MFRALIYTLDFIHFIVEHSFVFIFNLMNDIGITLLMLITIRVF